MGKGSNPKRSADSQINHNNMVRYIANDLVSKGYGVLADHINWPKGSPGKINGYIPDLTVTNTDSFIIFEIETCSTYSDDHTREQLTAFDKKGGTYIIIPSACSMGNINYDPVEEVKQNLKNWGLFSVRVGTCDPFTGKINYNV
ncbi:hypothetical protein Psch_02172 [Pelotomaculum schinkii]|uniref:Uncharacterized protein n=1 Tax=Pelotomaculum schinkii TaxID=78350 RepID=A0A4Y7RIG3_9FIRM|nr:MULTISPECIES: hypothetical protein [Pelotomaculum]TEB08606.1 hypothetical protein Psch_02172 [Pelotomaculum schinkii]TEB16803.1 hypothetical protein Psfp_00965 [Pelotomaculum sp. FP]